MTHPFLARLLLTGLAAAQGLAALKIDLHRSHATNPLWTPHARFHVVWQVLGLALAAGFEVALIWWIGRDVAQHFYVAACLVASPMLAFWGALAGMRLYGGALFDPNGILPWRVRMGRRILQIDGNTVAVTLGSIVLLIAVAIY